MRFTWITIMAPTGPSLGSLDKLLSFYRLLFPYLHNEDGNINSK